MVLSGNLWLAAEHYSPSVLRTSINHPAKNYQRFPHSNTPTLRYPNRIKACALRVLTTIFPRAHQGGTDIILSAPPVPSIHLIQISRIIFRQISTLIVFTMVGFNIQNLSAVLGLQAFVSSFSVQGGDEGWFTVPANFSDPALAHWSRDGYEVIGFWDPSTPSVQRGWYIDCTSQTVNLTFYGFEQDIGLVRG